ncbi:YkgB family protein [Streptomyces violaceoruber]
MSMTARVGDNLSKAGLLTTRYGLALNVLWIGRLKFEDYEVENIRPLVTSSPLFSSFVEKFGERNIARAVGVTEISIGALIAARRISPKASTAGSLAAAGMFVTTLSFLVTTPEAWHESKVGPKLSIAGQFLLKDLVLFGASLVTAAEALRSARRPGC